VEVAFPPFTFEGDAANMVSSPAVDAVGERREAAQR
jgi:hypothetical protein